MRLYENNRYFTGSFILILVAGVSLAIVLITDRKDLTTASVVISAFILFLSGIVLITFSRTDSIDERIVSLLQVQGTINLCRIASDLKISGKACVIPDRLTGSDTVMQLIPVAEYSGEAIHGDTFVTAGSDCAGMLVLPVAHPLIIDLKKRSQLMIPGEKDMFQEFFIEVIVNVLEMARGIRTTWTDEGVIIQIDGYRLIEGCRRISAESPACCTMNPCILCSLIASCIAEGLDTPVRVERCIPEKGKDSVEAIFSVL